MGIQKISKSRHNEARSTTHINTYLTILYLLRECRGNKLELDKTINCEMLPYDFLNSFRSEIPIYRLPPSRLVVDIS